MNAKYINMSLCMVVVMGAFSVRALQNIDLGELAGKVADVVKEKGNLPGMLDAKKALQNINLAELFDQAKAFAAKVVGTGKQKGVSESAIKEVAKDEIFKLPDHMLGLNIDAIKTGKLFITPEVARAIATYLPVAISSLDKVDAVAKMAEFSPELAIGMLETANTLGLGMVVIPAELKTVADKAFAFIKSHPEEFKAVLVPVGYLVESLRDSLTTLLASAKAVNEGKGPQDFSEQLKKIIVNEISSKRFSDLKDKVFDQIVKLVQKYGPVIKELVEKMNLINKLSPEQLSKAFELITKQISK